ncbi:MAG: hypothetical protein IPM39_05080 [Chloroflexi bacterium]|nr:hypothetical protein [Chloroflexota bacterium]
MKTIILLADQGIPTHPAIWERPRPLWNVAGKTILGHLLDLLMEVLADEAIFVVGASDEAVKEWIADHYPQLEAHFVVQSEEVGQGQALALCDAYLDQGGVLVVAGMVLVEAAFADLPDRGVAATFLSPPETAVSTDPTAAIAWFRNGRSLYHTLQSLDPAASLGDIRQAMQAQGAVIADKPAHFWLETHHPDTLLHANQRLLSLSYGATPDAIERSYAEDFTVLPPVFIDEEAYVEAAVIGPYASIHAGAVIKNAIVRHSIIAADAQVENCILDGALVGERAKITGKPASFFIGDDSMVETG